MNATSLNPLVAQIVQLMQTNEREQSLLVALVIFLVTALSIASFSILVLCVCTYPCVNYRLMYHRFKTRLFFSSTKSTRAQKLPETHISAAGEEQEDAFNV